MSRRLHRALLSLLVAVSACGRTVATESGDCPKVVSIAPAGNVVTRLQGQAQEITNGQHLGSWTLMAVTATNPKHRMAVFEDFTHTKGHLVFTGVDGKDVNLPKSLDLLSAVGG